MCLLQWMKVQFYQSSYCSSTVGESSYVACSCSVDEGIVPPIKNSDHTHVELYIVCVCVCVCVGGWVGGGGG